MDDDEDSLRKESESPLNNVGISLIESRIKSGSITHVVRASIEVLPLRTRQERNPDSSASRMSEFIESPTNNISEG